MMTSQWEEKCKGPGRSGRLQPDDVGLKWPRYDVRVSPDNRNMNFEGDLSRCESNDDHGKREVL